MNEATGTFDFDYSGFAQRLKEAIFPERTSVFSDRVGVPQPTVSKYLRAEGIAPRLDISAVLARGAGVTLEWLVWGIGDGPDENAGFVKIPRFDATLAAGAGSWNDGRRRLDDIPFTATFLRKRLGRSSAKGLSVLEARGDSMEPTIANGALLLIDEDDRRIDDGVFAFVLDDVARVKRFRKLMDGVSLISDNPAYPPETVVGEDQLKLQVIGHVLWVGQLL